MLAVFPNTALCNPTIEDRRDSSPVLLRRAITFIEENVRIDISLADIARAVYVTPRALQYMFRRHLDCTLRHIWSVYDDSRQDDGRGAAYSDRGRYARAEG